MWKGVIKFIAVLILGMGGGIFASGVIWPYLITHKAQSEQFPVHITETRQVIIQENTALKDAIGKVQKAIVAVKTRTKSGKVLTGSGLVVTSDGLIITLASLVPRGDKFIFSVDGQTPDYQILRRDVESNLALVKIKKEHLTTVQFSDFNQLRIGERVFLLGVVIGGNKKDQRVVNAGIVKTFNDNLIQTNILEKKGLEGGSLFNINGELVGIATITPRGEVEAIPVVTIKKFCGFK